MNHRSILDPALRDLPIRQAAYIAKLADQLDIRDDLEERRHLLYPVLAAAARDIEPVLEPAECAALAVAFLDAHAEGVARTLYSPAFLTEGTAAMKPWADRLLAAIAGAILDRLKQGDMSIAPRKVWRFRADGTDPDFPYRDDGD